MPGVPEYCNGVAVFLVNEKESKTLVNELFLTSSETGEMTKTKDISLEILNGTGSTTKLNKVIEQLKNHGYKITKQGNTNITNVTTVINRTKNSTDDEKAITSLLGTGKATTGEDNSDVDFTIILGKDY